MKFPDHLEEYHKSLMVFEIGGVYYNSWTEEISTCVMFQDDDVRQPTLVVLVPSDDESYRNHRYFSYDGGTTASKWTRLV